MEHSTSFTTKDGTEYKLTYDNETGDGKRMHYLLHEDGVLKLECHHHAVPGGLTEDEFKSAVVPLAFLNCLGRTLQDLMVKDMAERSGDPTAAELAKLITPHVSLEPDQVEYVHTIASRGHSVELFVQVNQELEVEKFARALSAEPDYSGVVILPGEEKEDEGDFVRPAHSKTRAFLSTYYPAIIWCAVVTSLAVAYVVAFGV
jgi:hypothetical protein